MLTRNIQLVSLLLLKSGSWIMAIADQRFPSDYGAVRDAEEPVIKRLGNRAIHVS